MFHQEKMEQCWIEVIPASLLQQWEITEEVQKWIKINNPAEVRTRPAVPEDPDTDIEAERLIIDESGGRAHPDGDEVTSHPV